MTITNVNNHLGRNSHSIYSIISRHSRAFMAPPISIESQALGCCGWYDCESKWIHYTLGWRDCTHAGFPECAFQMPSIAKFTDDSDVVDTYTPSTHLFAVGRPNVKIDLYLRRPLGWVVGSGAHIVLTMSCQHSRDAVNCPPDTHTHTVNVSHVAALRGSRELLSRRA